MLEFESQRIIRPYEVLGRPREECGVFGLYLSASVGGLERVTFNGLLANQHRGEESAGIVCSDGKRVYDVFKRVGLVNGLYGEYNKLPYRPDGRIYLAHTRYSTTGSSCIENASPYRVECELGAIAVAHNGNLINSQALRNELLASNHGVSLTGTTDSEVLTHLIATSPGNTWEEKIEHALSKCNGSYSLAIITRDALYAVRDPVGNRPLFWASFSRDGATGYAVSSETPAFNQLAKFDLHEVKPGELVRFRGFVSEHFQLFNREEEGFCGLEIAYLLRADGRIKNGMQVDLVRRSLGERLAELYPPAGEVDMVTYIPESSRPTAEGFAKALSRVRGHVPIYTTMLKDRYGVLGSGGVRGFIQPDNLQREVIARSGYLPFDLISGKRVVLVDDSIIRGNTTTGVINAIRGKTGSLQKGGVGEVHLRIPWPTVSHGCNLGTDISEGDWLIFRDLGADIEAVRRYLGVDTLEFLTPQQFQTAVDEAINGHLGLCMGCSTGKYPMT